MKILHISKFYPPEPGGIENFVADVAGAQVRQGHEVYVLSHQTEFARPGVIEQVGEVTVERVRTFGRLAYAPISPEFFLRLRTVMARFRPNMIHAHVPNISAFWLLFVRKTGFLTLHWHADVVASRIDRKMALFYKLYRPWETRMLKASDLIISTSNTYLQHSAPLQKWRRKCIVVPLGIDPARMRTGVSSESVLKIEKASSLEANPLHTPEIRASSLTVLSVGRFTYYKGFEYLVEAAEKLPHAHFILVGDGPRRPAIRQMVAEKGLKNRVQLPGQVDQDRLRQLLADCDLFCLSSIERTEAFGLVLLEAMFFGKPLVTTQIPGSGVCEVNVHGHTGLQVPPADASALAKAISTLHHDPETRLQMGRQARLRFERHYNICNIHLYGNKREHPLKQK